MVRSGNVWEIRKADFSVKIPFWGKVEAKTENGRLVFNHLNAETVTAVPHDMPVIGYNSKTINTLRCGMLNLLNFLSMRIY